MACTRSEHFKLKKEDGGTFSGWVDIPAGKHQFKFITDGSWITSDEFDRELDGAGNTNNVLEVRLPEVPDTADSSALAAMMREGRHGQGRHNRRGTRLRHTAHRPGSLKP